MIKHGVENAVNLVRNHDCLTCSSPSNNDMNLLFDFDPEVIVNTLRNYR